MNMSPVQFGHQPMQPKFSGADDAVEQGTDLAKKGWKKYKDTFKKHPGKTAAGTMAALLAAPLGFLPVVGGTLLSVGGVALTGAAGVGAKVAVDKAKEAGLVEEE